MAEYISKDEIAEIVNQNTDKSYLGLLKVISQISELPGVDIIHCRHCKYANKKRLPQDSVWYASCDQFNTHSVMADDFCSYGKRCDTV